MMYALALLYALIACLLCPVVTLLAAYISFLIACFQEQHSVNQGGFVPMIKVCVNDE